MARLIVKSPYIKCGAGQSAGGYLKYIATRERVEIIPDGRPPTQKQTQLIAKMVKDFPDAQELMEYEDYSSHPTKANASALITLTLEANWDRLSSMEGYAKYIALRPRAERLGEHGLFGDDDAVDLAAVADELDHYTGNVWTHIISLHREDAERLGYDHADAWRTLLRTHRNDIAAAMKIPPEDFHWYAAFHDEGNHPHVHMMAWSVKPDQAYLSKDGIRRIKSTLTNQIFRQELLHVYEQKSKSRDELVAEARKAMLELAKAMREMTCIHPEAEQMIWNLSRQLGQVGGKKTYGYLPKPMKKLVDEIVDQMARLPTVDACYQTWWELQCQVEDYYSEGKRRLRPPLSQQKEFRQIKNAVIKEAEHIRMNRISFEDEEMQDDGEQISAYVMSYECQDLQSVANDDRFPLEERDEAAEQVEQLADAGDAYAQYIIGTAYRDGGLLIPDMVKAQKLLERAAEQDLDAAQYALGKLYLLPRFIPGIAAVYAVMNVIKDSGSINRIAAAFGVDYKPGLLYDLKGIILSNLWFCIPFAAMMMSAALSSVNDSYVESARDAGCSWRDVLCRIILPLTYKDVIVSATFILMGQVGAFTIPYLTGPNNPKMLGILLYQQTGTYMNYERAAALSVLMFLICLGGAIVYIRSNMKEEVWETGK